MGIMDMFKAATAQQPQQNPNQATPGNIPDNAAQITASLKTPGAAANGMVPGTANADDNTKSPLDTFNDLWKNDPSLTVAPEPLFKISNEQLVNASRTQDFRNSVTKEQLTSIAKGGPEAVEAFANALNTLAQDTYARSAVATTKLIEQAVAKNNNQLTSKFNDQIRSTGVSNSLKAENPAFSNPAVQPLIQAMQSQMLLKYPNASESEIKSMALQYINAFAQAVTKPEPAVATKQTGEEIDWSSFLE